VKDLAGLLPFVLIALVFWLLIVRPQRRRQQALAATQSTLAVGSDVMLGSGIYGTVASLDDETILLELSPGTVVKVARQAVAKVLDDENVAEADHGLDSTGSLREPGDQPDRGDERPGTTDQHQ